MPALLHSVIMVLRTSTASSIDLRNSEIKRHVYSQTIVLIRGRQLLIAKAQDENGNKMFSPGEIDVLKHEVKDKDLQQLMLGVLTEESDVDMDPKS